MPRNAPVLFLSHGAPSFALEPGRLGTNLQRIGQDLTGMEAILVVSAHWQSRDVRVMTNPRPDTIHDFRGFDPKLHTLRYPAPGHPAGAAKAAGQLREAGFEVIEDNERGLDHGAWVPLLHLRPEADIPVFQVSLPMDADTGTAERMGRALAPLRREGIVIIGSGSLTHNLYEALGQTPHDADYALAFSSWIRDALAARRLDDLRDYRRLAPAAERSHPTEEHFLPLLVAAGAAGADEAVEIIPGEMSYGVLAMESYGWGIAGRAT